MEDILILAITIAAGITAIYAVIKALGFREYLGGKKLSHGLFHAKNS